MSVRFVLFSELVGYRMSVTELQDSSRDLNEYSSKIKNSTFGAF